MADKGFRFDVFQSDRETHQHIAYQLKRIADALEQSNKYPVFSDGSPVKCSFCDCVDPNAIQMQAVGTPGNMQPVCEYCYGKLQEAGEAAMESLVAAGIVERSEGDSTDDDA